MDNGSFVVEQVVFSVALRKHDCNDVVLVAASPGVIDDDLSYAEKLATSVTLPSERCGDANFFCFFRENDSCVFGRLTPDNESLDSQSSVFFQCMFLSFDAFCYVGANPDSLNRAALNTMFFSLFHRGKALRAFELTESALRFNEDMCQSVLESVDRRTLALLVQSILENEQTFLLSTIRPWALISTVFSLFPLRARGRLNVSSELYFRGMKQNLTVTRVDSGVRFDLRRLDLDDFTMVFDLDYVQQNPDEYRLTSSWASYVYKVLSLDSMVPFFVFLANNADESEEDCNTSSFLTVEDIENLGVEALQLGAFDDAEEDVCGDAIDDGLLSDSTVETVDSNHLGFAEQWQEGTIDEIEKWKSVAKQISYGECEETLKHPLSYKECSRDDSWKTLKNSIEVVQVSLDDSVESTDTGGQEVKESAIHKEGNLPCRPINSSMRTSDTEDSGDEEVAGIVVNGVTLTLGAFALLSAVFPEKSQELRRLDELVNASCKNERGALLKLESFCCDLKSENSHDFLIRVRAEYLASLRRRLQMAKNYDPELSLRLTTNIIDVVEVIGVLEE